MSNNAPDFDIELGASCTKRHAAGLSPVKDRSKYSCACGSPAGESVHIYIASSVIRAVQRQALNSPGAETGGVLLGRFHKSRNETFLEVMDIIEAANAKSTDVSLTFTHETWEHIARQQSSHPDLAIVGWYHSHPGLGVFLSKEDRFIHSSYFSEPWQIALVVDPEQDGFGVFRSADGEMRQVAGFYVFGSREEADTVRECARSISNAKKAVPVFTAAGPGMPGRAAWAAILLIAAVQAVMAYALIAGRPVPEEPPSYYAEAAKLLSACDLSGAEQMLRLALVQDPSNESASRELRRLTAIAQEPGVENPSMDRVNFLLTVADQSVRGGVRPVGRGELDSLVAGSGTPRLRLEAQDPALEAFYAYRQAESSRKARLARAAAVKRAAASHGSPKWPDRALKWLAQERLREIAYGLHTGQSGYDRIYSGLSKSDKAVVNSVRASIGRNK